LARHYLDASPRAICDFGAGNGELCKLLAEQYEDAQLICYEPTPQLLIEARQNLSRVTNVELHQDTRSIPPETLDLLFCLEVFEHLPTEETVAAMQTILRLLRPGGIVIIGVPVEIGLPALYKGLFRMSRRYGAFDANLKNVTLASLGHPPRDRPISEIAPGLRFHFHHTGFDFRRLKETVGRHFRLCAESASPFPLLGARLMPEIYFVAKRASPRPLPNTEPRNGSRPLPAISNVLKA
jgi:SAM-dependent methyltransferase